MSTVCHNHDGIMSIVIEGLISYQQVTVSSPYIKNLNSWKDLGAHVTTSNERVVEDADVIFLAIKPVIFPLVMSELQKSPNAQNIKNKLFLSILAGISLNDLEKVGNINIHVPAHIEFTTSAMQIDTKTARND